MNQNQFILPGNIQQLQALLQQFPGQMLYTGNGLGLVYNPGDNAYYAYNYLLDAPANINDALGQDFTIHEIDNANQGIIHPQNDVTQQFLGQSSQVNQPLAPVTTLTLPTDYSSLSQYLLDNPNFAFFSEDGNNMIVVLDGVLHGYVYNPATQSYETPNLAYFAGLNVNYFPVALTRHLQHLLQPIETQAMQTAAFYQSVESNTVNSSKEFAFLNRSMIFEDAGYTTVALEERLKNASNREEEERKIEKERAEVLENLTSLHIRDEYSEVESERMDSGSESADEEVEEEFNPFIDDISEGTYWKHYEEMLASESEMKQRSGYATKDHRRENDEIKYIPTEDELKSHKHALTAHLKNCSNPDEGSSSYFENKNFAKGEARQFLVIRVQNSDKKRYPFGTPALSIALLSIIKGKKYVSYVSVAEYLAIRNKFSLGDISESEKRSLEQYYKNSSHKILGDKSKKPCYAVEELEKLEIHPTLRENAKAEALYNLKQIYADKNYNLIELESESSTEMWRRKEVLEKKMRDVDYLAKN